MQESLIEKGRAVESGLYLCTSQVVAHKLQITPTNWTMSKPGAFLSPLTLLSFSLTPSHTSVWIILFQKQLQPPPPPPSHTAKLPQDNYQAKIVHHPWGLLGLKEIHSSKTTNLAATFSKPKIKPCGWPKSLSDLSINVSEKVYTTVQIKSHVINHTLTCMEKDKSTWHSTCLCWLPCLEHSL